MSTTILTNAVILHHNIALHGVANQITLNHSVETQDDTVFGHNARSNKGGLHVLDFSASGFVDYESSPASDQRVWDAMGDNTITGVLQVGETPDNGSVGYAFKALKNNYTWGGAVGDILPFAVDGVGRTGAPLVRGNIIHPLLPGVSTSTTGTPFQLGAAGTNEKLYGAFNSRTGTATATDLSVVVESDSTNGFTAPTTRLTFSNVGVRTSAWQSTNGPITDDWWRVNVTVAAGPHAFQVLLAIQ